MLATGLGLPPSVSGQFRLLTDRWDGGGPLRRAARAGLPLAIRIVHVARDASFQCLLRGPEAAVEVVRERAGGAFDPSVVAALSVDMLDGSSDWARAMAAEPEPHLILEGARIDDAFASIAAFADLADVIGHSSAVAELVAQAAKHLGRADEEVSMVRRAALLHDLGKVGVPFRIWHQETRSADDWEKIRLHAYYTERTLSGSRHLARLASVASRHHERLDGSGYHRGLSGSELDLPARLLASADAYRSTIEPKPGRPALTEADAAGELREASQAGTLDREAVGAVLEAAGHRPERIVRPDGLTPREEQALTLLAHGLATKQIGRALGVTAKTADHYVQQVYAKIGVSTRAAAAVYAMQHGLATDATREFSR
jgi:putative nucleotidyltransferase with HDIG domain